MQILEVLALETAQKSSIMYEVQMGGTDEISYDESHRHRPLTHEAPDMPFRSNWAFTMCRESILRGWRMEPQGCHNLAILFEISR
jgi:hypothetical protein